MTDLGTTSATFTASALRPSHSAFPTEGLSADSRARNETLVDAIAPTLAVIPLGFDAPTFSCAGPAPIVAEAVHAAVIAFTARTASDARSRLSRACHGCLVDGLDHNCGYTGF